MPFEWKDRGREARPLLRGTKAALTHFKPFAPLFYLSNFRTPDMVSREGVRFLPPDERA